MQIHIYINPKIMQCIGVLLSLLILKSCYLEWSFNDHKSKDLPNKVLSLRIGPHVSTRKKMSPASLELGSHHPMVTFQNNEMPTATVTVPEGTITQLYDTPNPFSLCAGMHQRIPMNSNKTIRRKIQRGWSIYNHSDVNDKKLSRNLLVSQNICALIT